MLGLRRKWLPYLAVMALLPIAVFLGVVFGREAMPWLFGGWAFCMCGYMGWCIRGARRRDSLPPDPPLGRGPDPFSRAKAVTERSLFVREEIGSTTSRLEIHLINRRRREIPFHSSPWLAKTRHGLGV